MECASSDATKDEGFINLGDYRKSIYGITDGITWTHMCKDDISYFPGSTVKMVYNKLSYSCMTGGGPTEASVTDTDTWETFPSLNQWALSRVGSFDARSFNTDCDYVFNMCSIKVLGELDD
jgi:hypothetical protein